MSVKKPDPPISVNTIRNLSDKLYDKRKLGALEVEQTVKELNKQQEHDKIMEVVLYLHESFIKSTSVSSKKGGLIGLAATALGLGQDVSKYINQLVPPVIQCFTDQDNKVRYYACESLYNIAKAARGQVLQYFNELFDDLCKLAADPDANVRGAADVLDGLVKDVVTEGNTIDMDKFIPMLSKRVYVTNTECRKFLVNWLVILDNVPDIEMVQYLPKFLDGVFVMLSDPSDEIRSVVGAALSEFLAQIKKRANRVDFGAIVQIVIPHCSTSDPYNFTTCQTAVSWVNDLIVIGSEQILPYGAILLNGILPCISHSNKNVEEMARQANKNLLDLVKDTKEDVLVKNFLDAVQTQFLNQRVPTRLASLHWVLGLYHRSPEELLRYMDELFPALLKTLSDPAEDVVRLDLQVLAKLSANDVYFDKLMNSLINSFRKDRKLLEHRGNLIVRQLSLSIKAEKIYRALSVILETEEDFEFASTLIQTLNLILLTATELFEVRTALKSLLTDTSSQELFTVLYRSWCHNPTAVFSLCLLSQVYEHSSNLVQKFAEIEVTVSFLIEIDKLVQLLESPIFIYLRLQLLEPEKYPYLFKSLYGLLMLLPQSSAFETLKSRLNAVTSLGVLQLIPKSKDKAPVPPHIDFPVLLRHFEKLQRKHADHVRKVRIENERYGTTSASASTSAAAPTGAGTDSGPSTPRHTLTSSSSSSYKLTASSASLIRDGSSNSLPK